MIFYKLLQKIKKSDSWTNKTDILSQEIDYEVKNICEEDNSLVGEFLGYNRKTIKN